MIGYVYNDIVAHTRSLRATRSCAIGHFSLLTSVLLLVLLVVCVSHLVPHPEGAGQATGTALLRNHVVPSLLL